MPVYDMIETFLVKSVKLKPSGVLRFTVRTLFVGKIMMLFFFLSERRFLILIPTFGYLQLSLLLLQSHSLSLVGFLDSLEGLHWHQPPIT